MMRKAILLVLAILGIAVAAIYLRPPRLFGEPHVQEIQRLVSPDGRAEAIVQSVDGGATTSVGYCVYVVPKGGIADGDHSMVSFDGPTLANGEYGIVVGWLAPTRLEVGSKKAKQVVDLRSSISIQGVTYHVQRKS